MADITYIPTWAGFLYLAIVLDVFSRRIVGWAMGNHLRAAANACGAAFHGRHGSLCIADQIGEPGKISPCAQIQR